MSDQIVDWHHDGPALSQSLSGEAEHSDPSLALMTSIIEPSKH